MHRFIPALAAIDGAKMTEAAVVHHPRRHGQSKYSLMRTFKVILDLVTVVFLSGFQTKPIYMFGFAGLSMMMLSFIIGLFVFVRALFFGGMWVSPLFVIGATFGVVGVVLILMGLLAEIQIRAWYESSGKKGYIIKK